MFLGIDLGTSSIKAVLADQTGALVDHESAEYPVCSPPRGLVGAAAPGLAGGAVRRPGRAGEPP